MVRNRRELERCERTGTEKHLLQSPQLLHSLLDSMVETGAVPALCAKDAAIREDNHFMLDLIKAHLMFGPGLVAMRQVEIAWNEKPASTHNAALSPLALAKHHVFSLLARTSQPQIATHLELSDPYMC